ncbi:energy transducer TonB [Nodosilinea sp. PGN35]|uniref:energy transducer TonB n=1 Tax=Nodosilinea sp. PGN35 TaxID=3020489 RepID=UPI0023B26DBD|nr:energy transducer TonB [Nodosilinea sp. TSF1-S3]MDF0365241.1 energy transducer TonB [Nodosilinea sp. TSF1-S3]
MANNLGSPPKSRPLWQILLAPMLLASLGLHALVLMLPAGSENVVIPPPDPEQDSVAITRVPPAGESELSQGATASTVVPTAPGPVFGAPLAAPLNPGVPAGARVSPAAPAPAARPAQRASRQGASTQTAQPPAAAPPAAAPPSEPPPATTPPPSPPAASQPLFEGEVGDRLRTYVAGLNLSSERIDALTAAIRQRVTYTAEATTDAAFGQNLSQWQQTIREQTGLTDLTPEPAPEDLAVTYVQRACLSETPGPVQAGVLVSPTGSTRSQPVVLRSSGYGAVDDHALRAVTAHRFPPAGEARAYTVTVDTALAGQTDCLTMDTVAQETSATGS